MPEGTLSDEEKERLNERQQYSVRAERRKQEQQRVAELMTSYLRSLRKRPGEVGCAILEMPQKLRDAKRRDPYPVARNRLAREMVLPQVLLVEEEDVADKYESAVRDLVRMLGVIPTSGRDLAPAALTMLQRNEEERGGRTQSSVALAVAARVRNGLLECALPNAADGEPEWMPYALAMLRIMSAALSRSRITCASLPSTSTSAGRGLVL